MFLFNILSNIESYLSYDKSKLANLNIISSIIRNIKCVEIIQQIY